MKIEVKHMIDVTGPEHLEIVIREDGVIVWINIDGMCAFRACRIKELVVTDNRLVTKEPVEVKL